MRIISINAPIISAESAILKFGMFRMEIKSVTFPKKIRSLRFPKVPPRIRANDANSILDSFLAFFTKIFTRKIIVTIDIKIVKIRGKGIPKAIPGFCVSLNFKNEKNSVGFVRYLWMRNFVSMSKENTTVVLRARSLFRFFIGEILAR
jgi:hypothetical protein